MCDHTKCVILGQCAFHLKVCMFPQTTNLLRENQLISYANYRLLERSGNTCGRRKIIQAQNNALSIYDICLLNNGLDTHFRIPTGKFSKIVLSLCDFTTFPSIICNTSDSLFNSSQFPIIITDNLDKLVETIYGNSTNQHGKFLSLTGKVSDLKQIFVYQIYTLHRMHTLIQNHLTTVLLLLLICKMKSHSLLEVKILDADVTKKNILIRFKQLTYFSSLYQFVLYKNIATYSYDGTNNWHTI